MYLNAHQRLVYPEVHVWSWLEEEPCVNVLLDLLVQTAVKVKSRSKLWILARTNLIAPEWRLTPRWNPPAARMEWWQLVKPLDCVYVTLRVEKVNSQKYIHHAQAYPYVQPLTELFHTTFRNISPSTVSAYKQIQIWRVQGRIEHPRTPLITGIWASLGLGFAIFSIFDPILGLFMVNFCYFATFVLPSLGLKK